MSILLFVWAGCVNGFLPPNRFLGRRRLGPTMALRRATLNFEFPDIPYAAAVHYIHSPEQMAGAHKLGAPLFQIESVEAPRIGTDKSSISFVCSFMLAKTVRVKMFAVQPNESNLIFFKGNRAMYAMKMSVDPLRAFASHRLRLDLTLFSEDKALRTTIKTLMPLMLYVNYMGELQSFQGENPLFAQYRRAVLRSKSSDEFWIIAERVMREYSGEEDYA